MADTLGTCFVHAQAERLPLADLLAPLPQRRGAGVADDLQQPRSVRPISRRGEALARESRDLLRDGLGSRRVTSGPASQVMRDVETGKHDLLEIGLAALILRLRDER